MKRTILIIAAAALLACPGVVMAQMHGGGQYMMGPGMMNNMGMMYNMMGEMHQMMGTYNMTPAQQQEMLQYMNQMGGIMQKFHGNVTPQMMQQYNQQLKQMQQRLQQMKGQLKKK
jgi:hypothetical protein